MTSTILGDEAYADACATLPVHMIDGLIRYVGYGIEPGDFLRAVITNDLAGAFTRADTHNTLAMRAWVAWFYNYAPGPCWHSEKNMALWVATRGLYGDGPLSHDDVVRAQTRLCRRLGYPMFFPHSGSCYSCGRDVTQTPEAQHGCQTEHLTGCPLCHASWCD